MSIHKFLARLCRLIPNPHWQLMTEQYMKISGKFPEAAGELWSFMNDNRKFMKRHSAEYKIISLGADCMPRTFTTLRMLKPCRAAGEKGMPFDLANTEPYALAHFLENDFADYFDGEWTYDYEHKRWKNAEWTGAFYPHDGDCEPTAEGLEKLKKRMAGRINNFREALSFPGPVLFVMHKATLDELRPVDHKAEDIERLCSKIADIRGDKPFKVLVIACDHNDNCEKIAGAELVKLRYPHAEYIWHLAERFTPAGVKFEIDFMDICRNALSDLLKAKK